MAGCCGSDGRSRTGKLIWVGVWLGIAALVVGLWVWERPPHHRHGEAGPHGGHWPTGATGRSTWRSSPIGTTRR